MINLCFVASVACCRCLCWGGFAILPRWVGGNLRFPDGCLTARISNPAEHTFVASVACCRCRRRRWRVLDRRAHPCARQAVERIHARCSGSGTWMCLTIQTGCRAHPCAVFWVWHMDVPDHPRRRWRVLRTRLRLHASEATALYSALATFLNISSVESNCFESWTATSVVLIVGPVATLSLPVDTAPSTSVALNETT